MDDTTILGGTLNQLGQTVKQTAKQVIKFPVEMGKTAGEQIGAAPLRQDSEGQVKPTSSTEVSGEPKQWQSDEQRIKFLKDLYGAKDQASAANPDAKKTSASPLISSKDKPSEFQQQIADKTPEEQKKLMELRGQLHKDVYYDPTFNPPKKQEERPAEKVEKEKQQEMQELQQKEAKKPQPIAVIREQNKAEMFRGAAG